MNKGRFLLAPLFVFLAMLGVVEPTPVIADEWLSKQSDASQLVSYCARNPDDDSSVLNNDKAPAFLDARMETFRCSAGVPLVCFVGASGSGCLRLSEPDASWVARLKDFCHKNPGGVTGYLPAYLTAGQVYEWRCKGSKAIKISRTKTDRQGYQIESWRPFEVIAKIDREIGNTAPPNVADQHAPETLLGEFESIPPSELTCSGSTGKPLKIEQSRISFYESDCELDQPIPPGLNFYIADARCEEEGTINRETFTLRLQDDGDVSVTKAGSSSEFYHRCTARAESEPRSSLSPPSVTSEMALCDELGSSRYNIDNPGNVSGVDDSEMNVTAAMVACKSAMVLHPDNLRMAFNYANAAFNAKDTPTKKAAWGLLKELSDGGYSIATFAIASVYYVGNVDLGVSRDALVACDRFEKLTEAGLPVAIFTLGQCYDTGMGRERDEKHAIDLYFRAAASGLAEAEYTIGVLYEEGRGLKRDERAAEHWLRLASDQGFAYAANELGFMLLFPSGGRAKNYDEPFGLLTFASEKGLTPAHLHLAYMYSHGYGVPADAEKAAQLYVKILEAGQREAPLVLNQTTRSFARGAVNSVGAQLTREAIGALQVQLKAAGAYQGQIDGVIGPDTRRAMWNFCQCGP